MTDTPLLSPHTPEPGGNLPMLLLFALGWALAPLVQCADRYLWSDWEFAAALGVLIGADTLTGLLRAWNARSLSSRQFHRLFIKVLAYAAMLVTLHTISHHTVQGQPNSLLAGIVPYFDATVYAAIVVREALSIHENLAALGYPLLPARVLRHFKAVEKEQQEPPAPPPAGPAV